jgi:hypothetical protein
MRRRGLKRRKGLDRGPFFALRSKSRSCEAAPLSLAVLKKISERHVYCSKNNRSMNSRRREPHENARKTDGATECANHYKLNSWDLR